MDQIELNDSTADRYLLDAPGLTLIAFHSRTCGTCRIARDQLPDMELSVERICWIDAGDNGGLVERYEVFHLPALFVVRDGAFYGPVSASLAEWDVRQQISLALDSYPAELP
jgi:thioredoxin 1